MYNMLEYFYDRKLTTIWPNPIHLQMLTRYRRYAKYLQTRLVYA